MLGIASNLGMTYLASLASGLETKIRKQELESIPGTLKKLQETLNQILQDLETYFQTIYISIE